MYCVRFLDPLRGKFGFFNPTTDDADFTDQVRPANTEGNEGSEDSCGYGLDFLQKVTKRTKVFGAAEDKAFVSFVVFCLESSPVHPLYEKADKLSSEVIGAAIEVHRKKGPGLIESIYERCTLRELELRSIPATTQRLVRVEFKGLVFDEPLRFDLLVDQCLLVELK